MRKYIIILLLLFNNCAVGTINDAKDLILDNQLDSLEDDFSVVNEDNYYDLQIYYGSTSGPPPPFAPPFNYRVKSR